MLIFNPGPSKVSDFTKENIALAAREGVLEISHRSKEFSAISEKAILGLRDFFSIPANYKIFYTASATEAIQLSLLNCCQNQSFHFVNGSFSNLFGKSAKLFGKNPILAEAEWGSACDYDASIPDSVDFISITHNETSTGCVCQFETIQKVRAKYPDKILAIDITSSAGAAPIEINQADIWLFSVQKCFGLPAGLGVLIVSPRAFQKSLQIENNYSGVYSLENMRTKMEGKYQTVSTPNALNIFLLGEILAKWNSEGGLEKNIENRDKKYSIIASLIQKSAKLEFFIKNEEARSKTVISVKASEDDILAIHQKAKKENIVLGSGYGKLKQTTFRIANFPAVTEEDVLRLEGLLKDFR